MNNKERREIVYLLELAADLATAKTTLDPDWPTWRKKIFWTELDPSIKEYKLRAKALTGTYVTL